MSSGSQQQGFAIALLLWMIAGMSLMVAAVIHFARADIGMAELRLMEARARAVGRGAALLAVRDREIYEALLVIQSEGRQNLNNEERGANLDEPFSKRYEIHQSVEATVTLRPAASLISLNMADESELTALFTLLGKASAEEASAMVAGVLAYRVDFPGFRFTEELLSAPYAYKGVYDNVADFVHPYRTGAVRVEHLAADLGQFRGVIEGQSGKPATGNSVLGQASLSGGSAVRGRMTFESIADSKRLGYGGAEQAMSVVMLDYIFEDGSRRSQTMWVSSASPSGFLRAGPLRARAAMRRQ